MWFTSLIGLRLAVPRDLLKDLRVHVTRAGGRPALVVEGNIMESAKVFKGLKISVKGRTIEVTVYASLPFWNRRGSPDFSAIEKLAVPPGEYKIRYSGGRGDSVALDTVQVED